MTRKLIILLFLLGVFLLPQLSRAQDSLTLLAELWGEGEGDHFRACASAGDVNADGFMDIIVGTRAGPGYAKIFLGSQDFDTIPDVKMVRHADSAYVIYGMFGFSVACAGDVNKDGYDDVIVGDLYAYNEDNDAWNGGKAYVYFGGNPMDSIPDVILKDSDVNYEYGWSVSSVGDVNGDGYDDVAVGAPEDYYTKGKVYIYFGGEDMDNVLDVYIEGESCDALGRSVAGIGDVNSDGYDDVLIGAPQWPHWPYPVGYSAIYFGGSQMDSIPDITFRGDSLEFLNFGRIVSSAGDVNGDGVDELIVGGVSYKAGLFSKKPSNPAIEFDTLILVGEDTLPSSFGLAISSAGDLNDDGCDEVIVGDRQCGKESKGKAYIFYGGSQIDSLFDITLVGDDLPGSSFGYEVASAGDINGDGYNEVLVSSHGDSSQRGKVFIYTSKPTSVDEDNKKKTRLKEFFLYQNYPNPFNSTTTISFTVNSKQKTDNSKTHVKLNIYNVLGQKIKTLIDELKSEGHYKVVWDSRNDSGEEVASGIYFCYLKTRKQSAIKRILFLK
ncbi:MAG: T9SS type A sorting domain-containing protein [Candidatus Zixiibacteriota bacterium]